VLVGEPWRRLHQQSERAEDQVTVLAKAVAAARAVAQHLTAAGRPAGLQGACEVPECGPLDLGAASSVQHVRQLLPGVVESPRGSGGSHASAREEPSVRQGRIRPREPYARSREAGPLATMSAHAFPGGGVGTGVTMGIVAGVIDQGLMSTGRGQTTVGSRWHADPGYDDGSKRGRTR
jgi:hypothetical protein